MSDIPKPGEAGKEHAVKWYYKPVSILIAIIALGPFALPLVWKSPVLESWHKIVISIIVALMMIWFFNVTVDMFQAVSRHMAELQGLV